MRRLIALWIILTAGGSAAYADDTPSASRAIRTWGFVDAVGPRAGIWGTENGVMEAWIYPLKICRDLTFEFVSGGQLVPAQAVARQITTFPGRFRITYTGDSFRVAAVYAAAQDAAGLLISLEVKAYQPLEIRVRFRRDMQLMWPASIGTTYAQWDGNTHAFRFGADGYPFAAILGSPEGTLTSDEYATNYSRSTDSVFSLGTMNGNASRVVALAGSIKSGEEAAGIWRTLIADPGSVIDRAAAHYDDYLARGVRLVLPDRELQRAYDWSRVSMFEGLVDNPMMGRGLVAGIGPSKGVYRPGFAWFFGRDSFWTAFALISAGDFESAAAAIRFIAKYQRADGKIPHEIAQTATMLDWFKQFPYGYASADATPLFVIVVRDYVEATGDRRLLEELWPRLTKAMDFMRANADPLGFPKNYGVGHGWIEGGPLLPVRTEYYQAALGTEALRSLAVLTKIRGDSQSASELDAEYRKKQELLERTYWDEKMGAYSYAIDTGGSRKSQTYSLATVPMWFDLAEPAHARRQIELLADELFAADWGERIISRTATNYGPEGYHYGTVWPLFTGWTSVGEYRYHAAQAGWANLRANEELCLDGLGNTTEVISGMTYSPLSTASPHQIWSAAMVVSPLLRGLFGLSVNAIRPRITLMPHLPASWDHFAISDVRVGGDSVDLSWSETAAGSTLRVVNHGSRDIEIGYAPALARSAIVPVADVNGAAIAHFNRDDSTSDWHYQYAFAAHPGVTQVHLRIQRNFGYVLETAPLQFGSSGVNAKIIAETWSAAGDELTITMGGWPGRSYTLRTYKDAVISSVEGGQYDASTRTIRVTIPASASADQTRATVRIRLAPIRP